VLVAALLAATIALIPGLTSLWVAAIGFAVYMGVLVALRAIPAELAHALPGRAQLRP
jgi:hypothetical protein